MSKTFTDFPLAALRDIEPDKRLDYLSFHVATSVLIEEGAIRINRYNAPNCCINGTHIASIVFEHAGIQNRGLVVEVMAFTTAYTDKAIELLGYMPTEDHEIEEILAFPGAWATGCLVAPTAERMPEGSDIYRGHVAIIAQNKGDDTCYLLDLTLPQLNVKSEGHLTLVPWITAVTEAFVDGDERCVVSVRQDAGGWATVTYRAYPMESDFTTTEAWKGDERLICESLKRRYDKEMAAHTLVLDAMGERE